MELGIAAGLFIVGVSFLVFIKLFPVPEDWEGKFLQKKVQYTSIAFIIMSFYFVYLYFHRHHGL